MRVKRVSGGVAALALILAVVSAAAPPPWLLRTVWRWPAPLSRAFNWLGLRGDYFEWEPSGTFRNGEIVEIMWGDRRLWLASFVVDLSPQQVSSGPIAPGVAVAWIETDDSGSVGQKSAATVHVGDDSDFFVVHARGLDFKSSFVPQDDRGTVRFALSRRVSSFSRCAADDGSAELRKQLIGPLIAEIQAAGATILAEERRIPE